MSDDSLVFEATAGDDGEDTLATYAQRAYLEYALSVVKGRALPDVCDGQSLSNAAFSTRCNAWGWGTEVAVRPSPSSPHAWWVMCWAVFTHTAIRPLTTLSCAWRKTLVSATP